MPTSKQTNEKIVETILRFLPQDQAEKLFFELSIIPGNKSFQTSMKVLLVDLQIKSSKFVKKEKIEDFKPGY